MRIFLSAGEASGDAYAAALVRELRMQAGHLEITGLGGSRLAAEIGALVVDTSHWGAISIVQSVRVAPKVSAGFLKAPRELRKGSPGLFIPIDFGFFNIRLCRTAKALGWKVLYFVPPGSWRRDKQGRDLPSRTDAVVTPFPWSADILAKMGANVHFFGHPIKQLIKESGVSVSQRNTVALLPGSRNHELWRNLPMLAGALKDLASVEFAISPNLNLEEIQAKWGSLAPGRSDGFTQGNVYAVLGRAQAGIICSGTATLEAALMRCPHVVVYRVTQAMVREAKIVGFKLPEFISLPNIILQRRVVPEIVDLDIPPERIRSEFDPLLRQSAQRQAQLDAFAEIDDILGPDDAITKTAELALDLLGRA